MTALSRIVRPHAAATASLTARQVAEAYNYPTQFTGKGQTVGIIELGGGFSESDLTAYFGKLGLAVPLVESVPVAGGSNKSDGPDGADGEVLLDIEVAASVAPGATFRVYFAPNTDAGFLAGIKQAVGDGCTVISISWGGPESSWSASTMEQYDAVVASARAAGVNIFVAAGDSGADDGTGKPSVDFPASSPNVVGCGGTRLILASDGSRSSEVTWDDSDTTSATGGGVSKQFPGRDVPDVAGNADPDTGYQVIVDGESLVIGGTSAVAPLYAGLAALLGEALGASFDFLKLVTANPTICFDVTSGDNGAFRAGPGRDETTGFGVVDGGKALTALQGATTTPPPVVTPPPVTPPPASSIPGPVLTALNSIPKGWENEHHVGDNEKAAKAIQGLRAAYGLAK